MDILFAIIAAPTIVIFILLLTPFGKPLWITGGVLAGLLIVAYYFETRPKPRGGSSPDNFYLHIMEIPIIISLAIIPVVFGLRYIINAARTSEGGFDSFFVNMLGIWAVASFVFLWIVLPYFLD
ncbi:MAG: hypothetical protein GQ535_10155 [Rhodobacteraceae bacterium]|nr:hypothetical protein [Paracoccaceae bacterium]